MSIQEISSNFKRLMEERDAMTAALILFVGIGSFLLGKSWSGDPEPTIMMSETAAVIDASDSIEPVVASETIVAEPFDSDSAPLALPVEGGYVASKNGTKYHLPWCSGAKRILEENKVWFKTKAEAEAAGYAPASNCKGI